MVTEYSIHTISKTTHFPTVKTLVVLYWHVTIRPINSISVYKIACLPGRDVQWIACVWCTFAARTMYCLICWINVKRTQETLFHRSDMLFLAVSRYAIPNKQIVWLLNFGLISRQHVFHWCINNIISLRLYYSCKNSQGQNRIVCFELLTVCDLG